jgi:hypothetical protein
MEHKIIEFEPLDDRIGCVGEYDPADELCTRHCALKLRCVIEYNKNLRLEVIEDIVASNDTFIKTQ